MVGNIEAFYDEGTQLYLESRELMNKGEERQSSSGIAWWIELKGCKSTSESRLLGKRAKYFRNRNLNQMKAVPGLQIIKS